MLRISPNAYRDQDDRNEFRRLLRGVTGQDRRLTRDLIPSASQKRRIALERGLRALPGHAVTELPFVKLDQDWVSAATTVLIKLGKALYYLHAGRILPDAGGVDVKLIDSASIAAGGYDAAILDELPGRSVVQHGKLDLSDQFSYRFGIAEDNSQAIFECRFNRVAVAILHAYDQPPEASDVEDSAQGEPIAAQ